MQSYIYLFFIVFSLPSSINSDECDQAMIEFLKQYNPLNFYNPIVNSGTGYNDFGKYDLCLANDFKYYLNKITFHVADEFVSNFEAYIGICIPEICYQDKKFEDWKVFINKYTQIPRENIQAIKSLEQNSKHQRIDAVSGTYIAITLIILLFTSGFVNAGKGWYYQRQYKDKEKVSNDNVDSSFINTCFNINNNYDQMFKEHKEKKDNAVGYGLQAMSMFVLIIVTMITVFTSYPIPIRNPEGTLEYVRNCAWQLLFNNTFCYDVLFFLFGFYFSYKISMGKLMTLSDVAYKIFYKFIRWYPAYLFIFFLYWKLLIYFFDGPVSGYLFNNEIQSCSKQWPFIVTLTQDIFYGLIYEESNANYYCFGWSWFIAAYMHYYIIGIALMYLYRLNSKAFFSLFSIVFVLFMGLELWILIAKGYGVTWYELGMKNQFRYFEDYYTKMFTRISPYLIGIIIGVMYRRHRKDSKEYQKNLIKQILCYVLGLSIMLFIIFIMKLGYTTGHDSLIEVWPIGLSVFYNFTCRKLFVIALFLIMVPLLRNDFYYFGGFLSENFFKHLSKLTVTAYLIQPTVIRYILLNARYQLYFDGWYILFYGIASIALSYVLAFLISLFFEMPMIGMKKYISEKRKIIIKKLEPLLPENVQ